MTKLAKTGKLDENSTTQLSLSRHTENTPSHGTKSKQQLHLNCITTFSRHFLRDSVYNSQNLTLESHVLFTGYS